jgi:FAD/FMN-containing dehydrogenase
MLESWGRTPIANHLAELPIVWRSDALPQAPSMLAYGRGRSYGDCCLNDGGALLTTRALDRFMSFDPIHGVLRCEAGVSLGQILALIVPRGWFLPVVPGTSHVSVGGAIANDIHGKNHHRVGTFGRHVRRLELLRSVEGRVECGPGDPLFAATVAGLGLTGLITWAELQLRPVPGARIRAETIPFATLDEFFLLAADSDARFEYTVAWLDCLSRVGRGVFFRGDHCEGPPSPARAPLGVPFDFPSFALNPLTVRAFNAAVYALKRRSTGVVDADPFFFPLDAIGGWNRIYGRRGFFQFQCAVPERAAIAELIEAVSRSGLGSFLTVLKSFGDLPSPGMLSFPRKGPTLTLDFANSGPDTLALLDRLEAIVAAAGGALYPAKDARMSRETFARSFPRRAEFEPHRDPLFSSSLWRRVA